MYRRLICKNQPKVLNYFVDVQVLLILMDEILAFDLQKLFELSKIIAFQALILTNEILTFNLQKGIKEKYYISHQKLFSATSLLKFHQSQERRAGIYVQSNINFASPKSASLFSVNLEVLQYKSLLSYITHQI